MTSQWDRLCAILELAEKLPAKDKSTYLQSALIALGYESRVTMAARDLKTMQSKMQPKSKRSRSGKKRQVSI